MPDLSVIIPNWNGEGYVARCIAATIQSAQASDRDYEILVVDDASSDASVSLISRDFPDVKLLVNPRNVGFGETVNRGVADARGEFLVLLNNDLVPREDMIREMLAPLRQDTGLFGVGAKTVEWSEQKPNHVNMAARWDRGTLHVVADNPPEARPAMFLQGGSSAFRRELFREFGSFSHLYSPGYWEDYDISYLALKAGWRNLYNPKAIGFHLGQGSMTRKYTPEWLWKLRMRNYLYFIWLNITDRELFDEHLRCLPELAYRGFRRKGDERDILRGLRLAIRDVGAVSRERNRRMKFIKRTDREVLAEFAGHGEEHPITDMAP
jgi:GT2 family glycosyltransferase